MLHPFLASFFCFLQISRISAIFHGSFMSELTGYRVVKVAGQVFNGNRTHPDHFSSIRLEQTYMLVGARNFIFNVSLHNLNEHRRISWSSNDIDRDLCMRRQKTQEDCQNYVRVLTKTGQDEFYACGTNSYKPMCRLYRVLPPRKHAVLVDEESGTAKVPFDHRHNSTAVYHNGRLYSATVADVNGRDALIFSKPLRTEHHDSQWLNDPSFVNSFSYGDRIYFFFRETAVENINCGKIVFSRVARVCANDSGGLRLLRNTWTSFSKARLNCSLPGDYPFYFNEILATSELGSGSLRSTLMESEQTSMIYALFSTPSNSIRGTAVCAFRMLDVLESFEGAYKEQRSPFHNWLPLRDAPVPHPGTFCPNSSHDMPDQTLNFIKSHPLMDRAVPTFGGQPIFIQTGFDFTLTTIAVDWQVEAANHRFYDVIFLGTDNGRVIKIYNKGRGMPLQTVVSEMLEVFQDFSPVTQLLIFNSPARRHREKKLLVVSKNEIKSIFLHRCSAAGSCSACVELKDPYCAWKENRCSHSSHGLQNLETGHHPGCENSSPDSPTASTTERDASIHDEAYYPQFQARVEPVEVSYEENPSSSQLLHRLPVPADDADVSECPLAMVPTSASNLITILSAVLLTFILTFPIGVIFGRFCRANPKFIFHWCEATVPVSPQNDNSTLEKSKFTPVANLPRAAPNSYEVKAGNRITSILAQHDVYANGCPRTDGTRASYLHYNL